MTVQYWILREFSLQLSQDSVGFAPSELHDLISAHLRIAIGIDAQLRRVARRPDVRDVAIAEIDAHPIEDIDPHDVVESKRGREEAHYCRVELLPVCGCRFRQPCGHRTWTAAVEYASITIELDLGHIAGWNQMSKDGLANVNRYVVE